jgi:hypothetical protein
MSPGAVQPGPVSVFTSGESFDGVVFDHPIDLNDDDDYEDEGEGWMAIVELNEDLINPEGENITVTGSMDLILSEINLESGAIARLPENTAVPDDDIDRGERWLPSRFSLAQNFPDPFSTSTEIRYGLPKGCDVHLAVYSLDGQRVATLVDERQEAGYKTVHWDAGSLPAGVYFLTLEAGGFELTRKMTLLR